MKEPIEILVLEKRTIKFYNKADYVFDSSDNKKTYGKTFISGDNSNLTSFGLCGHLSTMEFGFTNKHLSC